MSEFEQKLAGLRRGPEPPTPPEPPEGIPELLNFMAELAKKRILTKRIEVERYNSIVLDSNSISLPILETVNSIYLDEKGVISYPTEMKLPDEFFMDNKKIAKLDLSTGQIIVDPEFEVSLLNPKRYTEVKKRIEKSSKKNVQASNFIELETSIEWGRKSEEPIWNDSSPRDNLWRGFRISLHTTSTGFIKLNNTPGLFSAKPISIDRKNDPQWRQKIEDGIIYLLQHPKLIKHTKKIEIEVQYNNDRNDSIYPLW